MTGKVREYRQRIRALPDHDEKVIDVAANQLKMLQASFNTGTMDIDLTRITKPELLDLISTISDMKLEEFRSTWMFEPPFSSDDPKAWLKQAKQIRIAYLVEQFELISRLRDDDPEAWDEINELYFDD